MKLDPSLESPGRRNVGHQDDVALLERIARGDEGAFQAFYSRYAGRVLGILRRICPDRAAAEDLLQEAFMAVWRKASTYREDRGHPAGWLFAITRNKAFDHSRRRGPAIEADAAGAAERPVPGRLGDLERWDLSLSLEQALGKLESGERQALRMAYFGGFTYRESAERLEVPLGTLKSRIRTGLRKLHRQLEGA